MIAYLKGKIIHQAQNWIILDVGGVGYKVFVNSKLEIRNSMPTGRQAKQTQNSKFENSKIVSSFDIRASDLTELFIHSHIREDRQELYGLESIVELEMFEMLLDVSGVGPKMALNILSHYNIDKLKDIISTANSGLLNEISGIGKKLAMKILLDLKPKLFKQDLKESEAFDDSSSELVDAMESLGFKKFDIMPFIKQLPQELISTEEKIKWILKQKK